MKRREATAKRYARALFFLAREARGEQPVAQELEAARDLVAAHQELSDFLLRPWIKGEAKKSVIAGVAEGAGWSALARDFLGLLAVRGRLDHLPEVVRVYRRLVDEAQGLARAEVRSAVALTEPQRRALAEGLGRVAGRRVLVEDVVDTTLLGGFVARIGSLEVDGSLNGQLARLREQLVRG
ncbi:MAG: ATP synthase F1 subunit delta [Candidatus Rokubacteria bacterium]|nr:ATP synthase F1 subunit delta [Candidatus Rokubacteria bacterium]